MTKHQSILSILTKKNMIKSAMDLASLLILIHRFKKQHFPDMSVNALDKALKVIKANKGILLFAAIFLMIAYLMLLFSNSASASERGEVVSPYSTNFVNSGNNTRFTEDQRSNIRVRVTPTKKNTKSTQSNVGSANPFVIQTKQPLKSGGGTGNNSPAVRSSTPTSSPTTRTTLSRPTSSVVNYYAPWKRLNKRATGRKFALSNGARCVRYTNGSKGCFPLIGNPSDYVWNSYAKGTCLGVNCARRAALDHKAIDIYAPQGTQIFSVWDGTVTAVYYDDIGGNTILIDHPTMGLNTGYVHLHHMYVKVGDRIKAGHLLGTVGATGYKTSGAHLHFRINDMNHPEYHTWRRRSTTLTEYEIVGLAPFRGVRKGKFHGEHLVAHL